jgi:hypothetical protein
MLRELSTPCQLRASRKIGFERAFRGRNLHAQARRHIAVHPNRTDLDRHRATAQAWATWHVPLELDTDRLPIQTPNGPKAHPALRDELAGRAFIVRTLERLGLNVETIKPMGRPSKAWKYRDADG